LHVPFDRKCVLLMSSKRYTHMHKGDAYTCIQRYGIHRSQVSKCALFLEKYLTIHKITQTINTTIITPLPTIYEISHPQQTPQAKLRKVSAVTAPSMVIRRSRDAVTPASRLHPYNNDGLSSKSLTQFYLNAHARMKVSTKVFRTLSTPLFIVGHAKRFST